MSSVGKLASGSPPGETIDRARGGLGLGLTIVRDLVRLHGGSVKASSEGLGSGSEFTVRLPLLVVPNGLQPTLPAGGSGRANVGNDPKRIKVLVVEDYAPAAESLALLLQEMGYRTRIARDGAAALQAIEEFGPDAALVDIGLPVMDGYDVVRRVRGNPGHEDLPLIAITGYGQASDHARAMKAGFDDHLVKPLDASRIGELIDKLVQGNRLRGADPQ